MTGMIGKVSVLFSEPKIPQCSIESSRSTPAIVSVLFSEPKIPQWLSDGVARKFCKSFSALQRAENSSIEDEQSEQFVDRVFQCSSASRKFLNLETTNARPPCGSRFSALQRAENSSIDHRLAGDFCRLAFQCSSASRKFLNITSHPYRARAVRVSVLFSEPKIPQWSRVC